MHHYHTVSYLFPLGGNLSSAFDLTYIFTCCGRPQCSTRESNCQCCGQRQDSEYWCKVLTFFNLIVFIEFLFIQILDIEKTSALIKVHVLIPGLVWKNKSTHFEKWSFLCSCFFYLSLLIVQAWTVSVKKTQKSQNNKAIKTEHLIEITNHKMHGVQNAHSSLAQRHIGCLLVVLFI